MGDALAYGKGAFTVPEAAAELGISQSLTRSLIQSGHLPAYRFGKRKIVIYREELAKFRAECKLQKENDRS